MSASPRWFKSSYSNFASNCVEVARVPAPEWFKSSHSSFEAGNCVEAAFAGHRAVLIRDTQNREAAVLGVGAREWAGLTSALTGRRG